MITNPNPIVTTAEFSGLWITNVVLFSGKSLHATMLPYNGGHLLTSPVTRVSPDAAAMATLEAAITTEVLRLRGPLPPGCKVPRVIITAPDPARPVTIRADITTMHNHPLKPWECPDAFALAATDATFAGVLMQVMGAIGALAASA